MGFQNMINSHDVQLVNCHGVTLMLWRLVILDSRDGVLKLNNCTCPHDTFTV